MKRSCTLGNVETEAQAPLGKPSDSTTRIPLQVNLLVSVNNGRPKKKKAILSSQRIVLFRPADFRIYSSTSIPLDKILLFTRRLDTAHRMSLTIFFSAAPEDSRVETVEMKFDDLELLNGWLVNLARTYSWDILLREAWSKLSQWPSYCQN